MICHDDSCDLLHCRRCGGHMASRFATGLCDHCEGMTEYPMNEELGDDYFNTRYVGALSPEEGYFSCDYKLDLNATALNWLLSRVTTKKVYEPTCIADNTEYVFSSRDDLTQAEVDSIRDRGMRVIHPDIDWEEDE